MTMQNSDQGKEQIQKDDKAHCTAFCPKCGSDLYFIDKECMCKDKNCCWTCGGCKE